jgi:hypothetical protein
MKKFENKKINRDDEFENVKTIISKLEIDNLKLRNENAFLRSPAYLSHICDVLLDEYSIVLSPEPIEFEHGLLKYQINLNDLICIESDGKLKKVHFRKSQTSLTHLHRSTDLIEIHIDYNDLIKKLDPNHTILCFVNRKFCVNTRLYFNSRKKIICMIELKANWKAKLNEINIGENYFEEFIKLKCNYDQIMRWYSKLGR